MRLINEKTLIQKASLKKNFLKQLEERSAKLRRQFIEEYNQFLSNSLSSAILQSKEMLLQIKNDLLLDFEKDLINKIKLMIENKYSNYITFMINKLKKIVQSVGVKPSIVEISLNSKDYNYFLENRNKIEEVFSEKVKLFESDISMIGGFILNLPQSMISYDYSVENLIANDSPTIERIFSSSYINVDLESFQKEFEEFIAKQKVKIKDYLKKYDEIRT